jgi:molybdopterin-guanine dinucleotide biosynthesis protein A
MGRDKALVEVDGVALARRVADALVAAGCARVLAIGGDAPALGALGLDPVPDRWPGEGPLGGLATALGAAADADVVVLAPCDWLHPTAAVVTRLVDGLRFDADDPGLAPQVAHPWVGERGPQWLPSAWRLATDAPDDVRGLVAAGRRRLDAVEDLVISHAVDVTAAEVADADTPEDLP